MLKGTIFIITSVSGNCITGNLSIKTHGPYSLKADAKADMDEMWADWNKSLQYPADDVDSESRCSGQHYSHNNWVHPEEDYHLLISKITLD